MDDKTLVTEFLAQPSPSAFPAFLCLLQKRSSEDKEFTLFLLQALASALTPRPAAETETAAGDGDVLLALGRVSCLPLFYTCVQLLADLVSPGGDGGFRDARPETLSYSALAAFTRHTARRLVSVSMLNSAEITTLSLSLCERVLEVYELRAGDGDACQWVPSAALFHLAHFAALVAASPSAEAPVLRDRQRALRACLVARLQTWQGWMHTRYMFNSLHLVTPFLVILAAPDEKIDFSTLFVPPLQKQAGQAPLLVLDYEGRAHLHTPPQPYQLVRLGDPSQDQQQLAKELIVQYLFLSALAFHLTHKFDWEILMWTALKGLVRTKFEDQMKNTINQFIVECEAQSLRTGAWSEELTFPQDVVLNCKKPATQRSIPKKELLVERAALLCAPQVSFDMLDSRLFALQ
eukprot:Gregarina_sp_Pseudo_9__2714@NODE_295_length_3258_cov_23_063063_g276_i0_p1_GENE_NODE_295_length_3258_cov_23_063063_g276_i0NODE_295_length_3258_cov_23_063063_g276_i0_p1_ORF_typecomplete_len406_score144_96_NODE_295_length_3258_cov_23_063063_g276_i019663183